MPSQRLGWRLCFARRPIEQSQCLPVSILCPFAFVLVEFLLQTVPVSGRRFERDLFAHGNSSSITEISKTFFANLTCCNSSPIIRSESLTLSQVIITSPCGVW